MSLMVIKKNSKERDESEPPIKLERPFHFLEIILTQVRPEDFTTKGTKN